MYLRPYMADFNGLGTAVALDAPSDLCRFGPPLPEAIERRQRLSYRK
jgi:hypothetical protein